MKDSPATPADAAAGTRRPPWLWLLAGATVMGLVFGAQIYLVSPAVGLSVSWLQVFYWSFGDVFEWALLAPVVFWICRRFPWRRTTWPTTVLAYLGGGAVLAVLHAALCAGMAVAPWSPVQALTPEWGYRDHLGVLLFRRTAFNLAAFALIACGWHVWVYRERVRAREREVSELGRQLAQAQLAALRMQLNPHFLFNTLNTVSSLMLTDVRAANQVVSRLGALLRDALQEDQPAEIPLEREVAMALRYLEIEQVRFEGRLMVALNADLDTHAAAVPAFFLQPLVENAVRHAIAHRTAGGRIILRAWRERDRLRVELRDNGTGAPSKWPPSGGIRPAGIGLRNTRRRLETLYGKEQALELFANDLGGITVAVTLPFRLLSAPAP